MSKLLSKKQKIFAVWSVFAAVSLVIAAKVWLDQGDRQAVANSLQISREVLEFITDHSAVPGQSPEVWVLVHPRTGGCQEGCRNYQEALDQFPNWVLSGGQFASPNPERQSDQKRVRFVVFADQDWPLNDRQLLDWQIIRDREDQEISSQVFPQALLQADRDLLVADKDGRVLATGSILTARRDGHLQMALTKNLWTNEWLANLSDKNSTITSSGAIATATQKFREMVMGRAVKQ